MRQRAHHGFPQSFARLFLVPVLLGCAALSALFVLPAQSASAPNITSYQGRLLNANGVPIATGSASMVFEFYDSLAGGTCLYSNSSATCASATARTVTLTDGLFSENLGDTAAGVPYAAIADSVFGGNTGVYLQITVNGEVLSPRKQFVAAPYAMNADTLDGLDSSSFTSLFTDGGTTTYLTDTADDFAVGGTSPTASPFGVDESANTIYVGEGSTGNGTVIMKASDADTGQFALTTSDQFYFSGSDIVVEAGRGIDTQSAGAFLLGDVNATSLSMCNSAACDTISIGTNADADTISVGDALDTMTLTGSSSSTIVWNGVTISAAELALLDGHDAALVDTNDAVSTAITGTGALGSGSITSGFGTIDTGADNITTTGTVFGNDFDRSTAGTLTFGNTNATTVSVCNSAACDTLSFGTNADADTITIGDSTDSLALTEADWSIDSAGILTLNATSAQTTAIVVTDTDYTNAISVGDNNIIGTTANIDLTNFDVVGGTGNITSAGDLAVNGGDITSTTGTAFNFLDNTGDQAAIHIGGVTTDLANTVSIATDATSADVIIIGSAHASSTFSLTGATGDVYASSVLNLNDSAGTKTTDIGGVSLSATDTINIATNSTAADTITVGNSNAATTVAITGGDDWSVSAAGDLVLNGGNITSTSAIFNFLDTASSSSTIDIGGADADRSNTVRIATNATSADSVTIGSTHASSTLDLKGGNNVSIDGASVLLGENTATVTVSAGSITNGATTINLATHSTTADTLNFGNSNASTTFALTGGDDWSITSGGVATFSSMLANDFDRATAGTLTFGNTTATTVSICSSAACDTLNLAQGTDADAINLATDATSGDAINMGNSNASTTFDITGGSRIQLDSATAVYVNDGTGTRTVNIGGVLSDGASTVAIATNSTSADTITIGNSNASTTVAITGGDDWSISATGNITTANDLFVNGGDLESSSSTFNFLDAAGSSTTIDIGGVTANLSNTINIATNSTGSDTITIGNAGAATSLTLTSQNWSVTSGGLITTASDLALNGGNLTSTAGTFNFLDAASNSATIDIGGVSTNLGNTVSIATNSTTADTITIGNSNASTLMTLTGGNDWSVTSAGNANFTDVLTMTSSSGNQYITSARPTAATGEIGYRVDGGTSSILWYMYMPVSSDDLRFWTATSPDLISLQAAADEVDFNGDIEIDMTGTATTNGVCHSGADSDTTATARNVVVCSAAPDDYAEWYETESGVGFGDVVATSGAMFTYNAKQSDPFTGMILPGTVSKSLPIMKKATSSDTVFGIVSTSPNQVIGSDVKNQGAHPMPIALVGRVPLHVSSEGGPITVGDYLVPSSTPGYAMKANDAGRVVARALGNFTGTGMTTITVFIDNSWYGGDMLAADGSSMLTGGITISALVNATASTPASNSNSLTLNGSAWDGASAETVSMGLRTKVSSLGDYRLSIEDGTGGEVAAFSNAGDLFVAGKLFPSDRGSAQSTAYIFYDSTAGPGYMKTNAAGWNVGSYDFAEMFPSSDSLVAGDVVVFGGEAQSVAKSGSTTYDKSIAGVVSTRPGFLAGEYVSGSYPIALSGRVPTHVSDENGAVAIGDPLTSSSKPGYAMKATKAGPILGYAMEPLAAGEGKIIAFIRASYYAGTGTNAAPDANTAVSQLPSSSLSNLDVTGSLNMNGGSMLAIGSLEGIGGSWKINENGDFVTNGVITERVRSYQNELVDTFATTSREKTIQLSGTATLQSGQSAVEFETIDPKFNDIISNIASYRVIVTPAGITGQVYVTDKSNSGFFIHDSLNTNGVAVDWLVIAYQKDFEPAASVPVAAAPEPEPAPVIIEDPVVTEVIADNGPVIEEPVVAEDPLVEPSVEPVVEPSGVAIDPTGEPAPEVAGVTDPAPASEPIVEAPVDEPLPPPAESDIIVP